jgi:hypothetical protein
MRDFQRRQVWQKPATLFSLVLVLCVFSAASPGAASAEVPSSVAGPVREAKTVLATAKAHLDAGRFWKARRSLETLRSKLTKAHRAAMAQIGAPPTDPESDEPPGPPSVLAVFGLEHRITKGLVPYFNRMNRERVVSSLDLTLSLAHTKRDVMLDAVIAENTEEGSEYADGMSDTVPSYTAEVDLVTQALDAYELSASGREALDRALERVTATEAKVNEAFGGGE